MAGRNGDSAAARAASAIQGSLEALAAIAHQRPAATLGLLALLLAMQISPWLYGAQDASRNLSVARSMATGADVQGFGSRSLVVLPGYPTLIAPAFWLSERPFLLISIEHWLMAIAAAVGIYIWARRIDSEVALLITALAVLNATFMYFYRRPLKEVAFLALLIWLVNSLHPLLVPQSRGRTLALSLMGSALLVAASLIRYSAVLMAVVFAIAMLFQAWRRRVSWARALGVAAAIAIPPIAGAAAYVHHDETIARSESSPTYLQGMIAALSNPNIPVTQDPSPATPREVNRYWEGLLLKLSEITRVVIPGLFKQDWAPGEGPQPIWPLYGAISILVAIGWWRLQRRGIDLLAMMFPCCLLVYLPLATEQQARVMVPFLPLIMGCVWFSLRGPRFRRGHLLVLVLAHTAVGIGYWVVRDAPRAYEVHQKRAEIEQIARTIATGRDRVAMTTRDRARYELEFRLDRAVVPIRDLRELKSSSGAVDWVVVPARTSSDADYLVHATLPHYALLRRRPALDMHTTAR
jgi:hypothetical protein